MRDEWVLLCAEQLGANHKAHTTKITKSTPPTTLHIWTATIGQCPLGVQEEGAAPRLERTNVPIPTTGTSQDRPHPRKNSIAVC